MVRLQDSTKKKREYLPPFMIASYFYGDEKGNIVNIIWWLSFLSNAAVYVEFVSTIINMQYKGYCLNMAQHLRLSVARKIKFLIFKLIWGILFHNLNVNGSIFSTHYPYQIEYESTNLLQIKQQQMRQPYSFMRYRTMIQGSCYTDFRVRNSLKWKICEFYMF